jgi:hypothetical protein
MEECIMATAEAGGIVFLTTGEKLFSAFAGCRHNWSRPFTTKEMKKAYASNAPYDSHQQCVKCGATRLYDNKTLVGGPIFTRTESQHG